jgi:hypothetical protein
MTMNPGLQANVELQRLMSEHGKRSGSAAAAAGSGHVRGSEQVMLAHGHVNAKSKL